MESHSKAVRLVADQLHQMQHRRMMVKSDRFTLLPIDINNFLPLGNRGQRLVDDLKRFERLGRGMNIAGRPRSTSPPG